MHLRVPLLDHSRRFSLGFSLCNVVIDIKLSHLLSLKVSGLPRGFPAPGSHLKRSFCLNDLGREVDLLYFEQGRIERSDF